MYVYIYIYIYIYDLEVLHELVVLQAALALEEDAY